MGIFKVKINDADKAESLPKKEAAEIIRLNEHIRKTERKRLERNDYIYNRTFENFTTYFNLDFTWESLRLLEFRIRSKIDELKNIDAIVCNRLPTNEQRRRINKGYVKFEHDLALAKTFSGFYLGEVLVGYLDKAKWLLTDGRMVVIIKNGQMIDPNRTAKRVLSGEATDFVSVLKDSMGENANTVDWPE